MYRILLGATTLRYLGRLFQPHMFAEAQPKKVRTRNCYLVTECTGPIQSRS